LAGGMVHFNNLLTAIMGYSEIIMMNLRNKDLIGKETILVVEDHAAVRDMISTALRKYGFTVLEAANGSEALLICERQKASIHLILTDVLMPEISGNLLFERLTLIHPEMKAIYISGYTKNFLVHQGILNSDVYFIPKPFKMFTLMQKVREVIDSSQ